VILVDDRIGSVHYAKSLHPSQVERLEFGDMAFESCAGKLIGIEVKKIGDAVNSLLSGRLADHQLPGLLGLYDCSYLVVEGYYRCDPDSGLVQGWYGKQWRDLSSGRQRLTWKALDGWLTSMEALGGLRVRRTVTEAETVATVQSLYHWWQRDDHKSLKVFNTAYDAAAIERPGLCRRMAAELPLIGWERSAAVAKHFGTVTAMVNASVDDWMAIEGIGAGIAGKVCEALVANKI
jgi:ERCC4-type nuclease